MLNIKPPLHSVYITQGYFHGDKPVSSRLPVHYVVQLSDSREVLEASKVTLAPDRNWKAKLFPSLSSDFAENSTERERERDSETRQIGRPIMMQDANKGERDTVTLFTKTKTEYNQA